MTPPKGLREILAVSIHTVHGTRGLTLASSGLLLMAAIEPALPEAFPRIAYAFPLAALLFLGLATLPREGVAAQDRARALLNEPRAVHRMARRSLWGAALAVALLPNLFLAVQGIPHISPFAGLLLPGLTRWIGLLGILAVLLLAVLYLRSSRGYAPDIIPRRPVQLRAESHTHTERDLIMFLMWIVVICWGWMLQGYWAPFSLLEWHGAALGAYLESLHAGARSVASIAFTVVPPALLFIIVSAHLAVLRDIHRAREWRDKAPIVILCSLHVVLAVLAVILHAYNLFWIIRYRSLGFL